MTDKKLVTFRIPKQMYERFKRVCDNNGVSQRYILEKCIEQWLLIMDRDDVK